MLVIYQTYLIQKAFCTGSQHSIGAFYFFLLWYKTHFYYHRVMPLGSTTIMELFAGDMRGFDAVLLPASVFSLLCTFVRFKATAMVVYIKKILLHCSYAKLKYLYLSHWTHACKTSYNSDDFQLHFCYAILFLFFRHNFMCINFMLICEHYPINNSYHV